jgi:hypothetical protein
MTNDSNSKTEEAALLASLGSTTADASTYESSVLRDVKLRSAPKIALPHGDIARVIASAASGGGVLVPCGEFGISLPNLSDMTCCHSAVSVSISNNATTMEDVPHVLTVLSQVRRRLHIAQQQHQSRDDNSHHDQEEESRKRAIDLLHMKEQLCLSYLKNVAGVREEDGIIPTQRRKSHAVTVDAADEYYGIIQSKNYHQVGHDGDDGNYSIRKGGDAKHASSSSSFGAIATKGGKSSSSTLLLLPVGNSRLDQIKNGHQFNQNTATTTTNNNNKRKRNTIMSLKSQMRIDNGLTPLQSMEEEEFDVQQKRRRREERRRRRLIRRRQLLGSGGYDDDDDDEEEEFVDESEQKLHTKKRRDDDDPVVVATKSVGILKSSQSEQTVNKGGNDEETLVSARKKSNNGVRWAEEEEEEKVVSKDSNDTTTAKRSHTKVFCPICETILLFYHEKDEEIEMGGDNNDATPDAFLSRHIAECQQSSSGRGRRRTSRRTKKKVVNYFDVEDDVDDTLDIDEVDESTSMKEEVESVDTSSKLNDDTSTNERKLRKESSAYNPTSMDDMDEFDYEDRTEFWARYGLQQMNKMAEQDSTEIPPGAEVYDGGLEIPAWVNNRLFPYQRIGLRWMWELHCQGAGGVVGDEMGLGAYNSSVYVHMMMNQLILHHTQVLLFIYSSASFSL